MLYIESKSDKRIRQTASATVLILALSAGVLSYNALRELAIQAGIPPMLAFLFPITLDGLILAGSLLILYFAVRGKRSGYGLFLTALGVIASIAGNVVISPDNLTYQILHATSPVVLFLSLESLMILLRARSKNAIEAQQALDAEAKSLATASVTEPSKPLSQETLATTPLENKKPAQEHTEPLRSIQAPLTEHVITKSVEVNEIPQNEIPALVQPEEVQPVTMTVVESPLTIVNDENSAPMDTQLKSMDANQQTMTEVISSKSEVTVPNAVKKTPSVPNTTVETTKVDAGSSSSASLANQPSKRELIKELLVKDVNMEANDIINIIGGERKYVQRLIRAERAKLQDA